MGGPDEADLSNGFTLESKNTSWSLRVGRLAIRSLPASCDSDTLDETQDYSEPSVQGSKASMLYIEQCQPLSFSPSA